MKANGLSCSYNNSVIDNYHVIYCSVIYSLLYIFHEENFRSVAFTYRFEAIRSVSDPITVRSAVRQSLASHQLSEGSVRRSRNERSTRNDFAVVDRKTKRQRLRKRERKREKEKRGTLRVRAERVRDEGGSDLSL